MGWFSKIVSVAAPIVGSYFGGPVGGAIGSAIGGAIGGNKQGNQIGNYSNQLQGQYAPYLQYAPQQAEMFNKNVAQLQEMFPGLLTGAFDANQSIGNMQKDVQTLTNNYVANSDRLLDQANQYAQNPSKFLESEYYKNIYEQGLQGVQRQLASSGQSLSGQALAELQKYGASTSSGLLSQQIGNLLGVAGGFKDQLGGMLGGLGLQGQLAQQQFGNLSGLMGQSLNAGGIASGANSGIANSLLQAQLGLYGQQQQAYGQGGQAFGNLLGNLGGLFGGGGGGGSLFNSPFTEFFGSGGGMSNIVF